MMKPQEFSRLLLQKIDKAARGRLSDYPAVTRLHRTEAEEILEAVFPAAEVGSQSAKLLFRAIRHTSGLPARGRLNRLSACDLGVVLTEARYEVSLENSE